MTEIDGIESAEKAKEPVLPEGKIYSLPFLALRKGGGRGGAIQGKEGIKGTPAR